MREDRIAKKIQVGLISLASLLTGKEALAGQGAAAAEPPAAGPVPVRPDLSDETFAASLERSRQLRQEQARRDLQTAQARGETLVAREMSREEAESLAAGQRLRAWAAGQMAFLWEELHRPWQFDADRVGARWEAEDAQQLEAHRREMQARAQQEEQKRNQFLERLLNSAHGPKESPDAGRERAADRPKAGPQETAPQNQPQIKAPRGQPAAPAVKPSIDKVSKKPAVSHAPAKPMELKNVETPSAPDPFAGTTPKQELVLRSKLKDTHYVGELDGKHYFWSDAKGKEEYLVLSRESGGDVFLSHVNADHPVSFDGTFRGLRFNPEEGSPKGKGKGPSHSFSLQLPEIEGSVRAVGVQGCAERITPSGAYGESCLQLSLGSASAGVGIGRTGPNLHGGASGPSGTVSGDIAAPPICIMGRMVQVGAGGEFTAGPGVEGALGVKRTGAKLGLLGAFGGIKIDPLDQEKLSPERRDQLNCPPKPSR